MTEARASGLKDLWLEIKDSSIPAVPATPLLLHGLRTEAMWFPQTLNKDVLTALRTKRTKIKT